MEEIKQELSSRVTIKEVKQLFSIKDNTPADRIEQVFFNENDFSIVAGKGLWQVGQEVIYIFPDGNLKEGNEYLNQYINPTNHLGEPMPSKLGGYLRVKAIGFTFHNGDGKKVYSNGIICPISSDVESFIYKHEGVEHKSGLNLSGGKVFPSFLYKTDETNIKKLFGSIEYPISLVANMKVDGSSHSTSYNNGKGSICSRNLEKPLIHQKQVGVKYIHPIVEFVKKYIKFPTWLNKKVCKPIFEEMESTDDFVKYGRPYIDTLKTAYNDYQQWLKDSQDLELISRPLYFKTFFDNYKVGELPENITGFCLRAELCGKESKGSGNKNNPHSKKETGLEVFTVDAIINGKSIPQSNTFYREFCNYYNIPTVECILPMTTYISKEEIIEACEKVFDKRLIEGIVLRNEDTTFSAKYLSEKYDSLK